VAKMDEPGILHWHEAEPRMNLVSRSPSSVK
jgi:hypothetical protein